MLPPRAARGSFALPGLPRRRAWLVCSTAILVALATVSLPLVTAQASSAASVEYGIWGNDTVPDSGPDPDTRSVELGVRFSSSVDGWVTAIRFFKSSVNRGVHTGSLWSDRGQKLGTVQFTNESAEGWQEARLAQPIRVSAGQRYVASYRAPNGRYEADTDGLMPSRPRTNRALTAWDSTYTYGDGAPSANWRNANYFVDLAFTTSAPDGSVPSTSTSTTQSSTTTTPSSPSSSPTSTSTTTRTTQPTTTTRTTPPTSSTTSPSPTTTRTTSTPSPTTSSATTTPKPNGTGCVTVPSACGYPDATNTGVQPGVTLRSSSCPSVSAGAVIENLNLSGCSISISVPNVTIRNVKMKLSAPTTWAIIVREGGSATISNVEISGNDASNGSVQYAVLSQTSSPVKIDKANLYNCQDCVQGERVTVTNSYIHDLASPSGAHVDGILCNSVCGVTIRHNTILNRYTQTSAIALFADFGTPRDSVVDDNLLAGGGYTVYGGGKNATGISFTNNRFARPYYAQSGQWGVVTDFYRNNGNVWSGNIWDDTLQPAG